jgi:hypothetical protein
MPGEVVVVYNQAGIPVAAVVDSRAEVRLVVVVLEGVVEGGVPAFKSPLLNAVGAYK